MNFKTPKMKLQLNIIMLLTLMGMVFPDHIHAQDGKDTKDVVPNVIVFMADDVSWNDFGCYGNSFVQTPNIDKLASNGIRFNNAILTASSCSPSRVSIMTGRYPHNTGA